MYKQKRRTPLIIFARFPDTSISRAMRVDFVFEISENKISLDVISSGGKIAELGRWLAGKYNKCEQQWRTRQPESATHSGSDPLLLAYQPGKVGVEASLPSLVCCAATATRKAKGAFSRVTDCSSSAHQGTYARTHARKVGRRLQWPVGKETPALRLRTIY